MTKIPVGEAILYAYRFTFGHLGAIIGLIWLPMVLVTVAGFFAGQRYYADAAAAIEQDNLAMMGPSLLTMIGYLVLAVLLYATMYAAVTELALGTRKPGELIHFSFGRVEWRLFRAIVAFIGVMFLPVAVIVAVASLAGAAFGPALGQGIGSLVVGAALVAFDLAFIYVALRFAFLLVPVAVADDGPVLERAWKLSAGNFWRILGVVLVAVLPVLLLTAAVQIAVLGPASFSPNFHPTAAEAAAQMQLARFNMPLLTGISFVISPIALGLMMGAATFVYRSLTRTSEGDGAKS